MGITLSEVSALASRFGNNKVNEQTNMMAPFYASSKVKKRYLPGKTGVVNIKAGGLSTTKYIADGAALPTQGNKQPVQGTYLPKVLFSRLGIPRLAAETVVSDEDGVGLVLEQLDTAAEDLARTRGRALIRSSLGSPAANAASGQTTITVADPSGFRIGSSVDVYAAGVYEQTFVVADVNVALTGNSTITASANLAAQIDTTDVMYLQGSFDQGPVGLADICAAASLYGIAHTAHDWRGNLDSSTSTLTIAAMRNLWTLCTRRRGKAPDLVLLNSKNEQRYSDLNLSNRRFPSGSTIDGGTRGQNLEFEGKEVFVDENVGDSDIFFVQLSDFAIHEFIKPHVDKDGKSVSSGVTIGGALVDPTNFVWDLQLWEATNLRVLRRDGFGHMSAITA